MDIILDETDDLLGFKVVGKKNAVGGFEGTCRAETGSFAVYWNIVKEGHYLGLWNGQDADIFEFTDDGDDEDFDDE